MHKKILFAALAITVLAFTSCKNSKNSDNTDDKSTNGTSLNYDDLAQELCTCMQPLMDINAKIVDVAAAGDTEKAQELYSKISEVAESQEECVLNLEKKYGDINGAEQEAKAKEAMKKHCPDVVALMAEYE